MSVSLKNKINQSAVILVFILEQRVKHLQQCNGGAHKSPGLGRLRMIWLCETFGNLASRVRHRGWQRVRLDLIPGTDDRLWKGTASAWKRDGDAGHSHRVTDSSPWFACMCLQLPFWCSFQQRCQVLYVARLLSVDADESWAARGRSLSGCNLQILLNKKHQHNMHVELLIILLDVGLWLPVGRSGLWQNTLSARARTSACSTGRNWARQRPSSQSAHNRLDLCLCENDGHR